MTSTQIQVQTSLQLIHYSFAFLAISTVVGFVLYNFKSKQKPSNYRVKLIEKKYITHDTVIFTFLLPKQRKTLGLKVGEHLQILATIDGKIASRKYTPISKIDRKETFQLLIKIYRKCEQFPQGGMMSLYLDSLKLNDQIDISFPYGRFNYEKQGQVKIITHEKKTWRKKYQNFFMVAGGTGITPLYQIIQYITENQLQNSVNLTLLFANRSQEDILLPHELKNFTQKNQKLSIFFSVDKSVKPNWKDMVGYIDEQKVTKALGNFENDIENTIFLSCGPPILSNIVQKIWRNKFHVKDQNIFRF